MKKILRYYYAALKDIRLNSIPQRNQDGTYKWSNGQLEILTEERFKPLRINRSEAVYLTTHKENIKGEILGYQKPTVKIANEGEQLSADLQPEIDEEELNLNRWKTELRIFDDAMLNRGLLIPEGKSKEELKKVKETYKTNFKTFVQFVGIWILGEIFMTYVQWNGLRNENGVEDMVVRSLSFGVILFLIHLIADFNRNRKRVVYQVFITFSLLMLITMLFAPLIINKAYPEGDDVTSIAQQWSLNNTNTTPALSTVSNNPLWIEFYRDNEMIPAIFCFLFFVAMQSFMSSKQKLAPKENKEPEEKLETVHEHILRRREYLTEKIAESESRFKDLKAEQREGLKDNTGSLQSIIIQLEAMKNEFAEVDTKISAFEIASEEILTDLEKELNEFSIEFLDVLKSDEVKNSLVSPEWPTRNDIVDFYKIQTT